MGCRSKFRQRLGRPGGVWQFSRYCFQGHIQTMSNPIVANNHFMGGIGAAFHRVPHHFPSRDFNNSVTVMTCCGKGWDVVPFLRGCVIHDPRRQPTKMRHVSLRTVLCLFLPCLQALAWQDKGVVQPVGTDWALLYVNVNRPFFPGRAPQRGGPHDREHCIPASSGDKLSPRLQSLMESGNFGLSLKASRECI